MDYLIKPWNHQLVAIENASQLANYALFFEPGSGKSMTCINILRHKYQAKGRLLRTIVLCPPIVISNWKKEFLMNSKIPAEKIIPLIGHGKKRLETFLHYSKEPCIFITNYETLNMELYEHLLAWAPEALVGDESHRFKSHNTQRSKRVDKLANPKVNRPHVYLLSGSPVLNSPMDLFQQYKVMDGGITFGNNYFGFRARYFRDKNAGMPKQKHFPDWALIPGAAEEIAEKMKNNSMRVLKKDCMDLPPFVRKILPVPMAPGQRKLYDSMLQDFVAYFTDEGGKEHVTSAILAMTKGMRLMQIASGYVKTVDDQEISVTGSEYTPKQEALKELLQELVLESEQQVLVWACWKANYSQIREVCEDLKIPYVELHGDITPTKKMENVDKFNSGVAKVLIGHPGSGGIGVNLVTASHSIFYSRSFSLEHDLQAEARNYRGGSEIHEKITRIDLVTEGTIEEKVVEALANKQEIGEKLLREITIHLKKE